MADQDDAAKRLVRQTKLFHGIIHGHRELKSGADSNRFLEALCAQEDATKCVESLVAASEGLNAVAKAFRFSRGSDFLNGPATSVITYLSNPSLKQLYGGEFLHRVLEAIVDPPTFWNTLCEAYHARILDEPKACQAFAWLLLELLCSSKVEKLPDVHDVAEKITASQSLLNSPSLEVRNLGHKIKHILERLSTNASELDGPGGRHDNDFVDIRKVKILPTPDEFASADRPFYRRADAVQNVSAEDRGLIHLDNQFRLLREDLLGELRNDFQIATGQRRGKGKVLLSGLHFAGLDCGPVAKRKACTLQLYCTEDIPQLEKKKDVASRKKLLVESKSILKHNSLGCLIHEGSLVAFASVDRNEDLLALKTPVISLRIDDAASFRKVLFISKFTKALQFVQVNTAVFAYEPILKCLQRMTEVPLQEQILDTSPGPSQVESSIAPVRIINGIREGWDSDLGPLLGTTKSILLDAAQAEALLTGLTRKVSLIQGPPGTGKSFIGALNVKIWHDSTAETILIQTYTNHSLDQVIEDLLNIGIPSDSIVRLGTKYSLATKAVALSEQRSNYRMKKTTYDMKLQLQSQAESYHDALKSKETTFKSLAPIGATLMDYLEFSDHSEYFDAFTVPEGENGFTTVGSDGKAISKFYLLDRWATGQHAGIFHAHANREFTAIWELPPQKRTELLNKWSREILEEHVSEISTLTQKFDECQHRLVQLYQEKKAHIIESKRIIACTTTAAAMYSELLQKAAPGIILVEEAGEILESHTLTAMTSNTKQLLLIGDHKQLRPKVNNYALTIEKGDGYDLNMSMFERLVLGGVPHCQLKSQHRMRPEISSLVRSLTYPELEDAPSTSNRPNLRGCQDNIIFVAHECPELNAERIADRRDGGALTSKENKHEVDLVLKIVRYLGQQGYGTDKLVILTPYLGQLFLLMKTLSKDNDPILNDLDSFELIRAGLMSPAAANVGKQKIKISTIDNYQGEESNIVIATLTRSNSVGDIGFMSSPQRVNVLLSRARDGLILIGNPNTFINSRKGKDTWIPLMDQLKRDGHVYHGFPVMCEQHPDKKAILSSIDEFDTICPDGGCSEPCGVMLNCGQHTCPRQCHQLQDHSKMECKAIVKSKCSQNHTIRRKCHDIAAALCRVCEAEAKEKERKRQRDYQLDQERQAKQAEYARRLAETKDEIEHQKRLLKDHADEQDRQHALAQQQQDLENLNKKVRNLSMAPKTQTHKLSAASPTRATGKNQQSTSAKNQPSPPGTQGPSPDEPATEQDESPDDWETSEAKDDWEGQKKLEGAQNAALDELMGMIGLESVKQRFLDLKSKIDTMVRQNVSLKSERFGAALLGNPGTGKTTVARLYAKFLVEVGALPGDYFHETSGASLANDGVSACKDHIQKILEAGGGVMFIDETYQLVSGNSYGGAAVLDYLLAEIENLTGKVVFILAGYHKQMEAFFAHNPGIPSRIPIELEFKDYKDEELRQILSFYINKRYKGLMKVEDGFNGLYMRIVARRIGRGRGREGFGNAREVQNRIALITERQAKRLRKERKSGLKPDDNFLTKEDLIGPEPSAALKGNPAWSRLQKLIGLNSVKGSVSVLLDSIKNNYQRELEEKPLVEYSLNRCFIGSPGTGKTSVAKLYGRILADIGLLSNGEVVNKNPSDFVGSALGQSEANTKAILASTVGKVLIIDEAYMLAGTGSSTTADPYKTAVIDTLVAEIQSVPGEDRCVLLLGYKEQTEDMFRDVNPGLARRFPLSSAFEFEDFSDAELQQILDLKLKDIGFSATDQAKKVAMEVLGRARNRPNFGNAGEVDILLDRAKISHQKRMSQAKAKPDIFDAVDFDPEFDRGERAATNLSQLFQDVVGCEEVLKQLQSYQIAAANAKARGMDPREHIPFNFLFKGPPGTGKTTTAQKMGKVFYDMGFLAQAKVVECSATDLIGQYVGHTGPKVQKQLETALGKVLFIDEAYRLAEGPFASEAMDELVDCITKPKYAQKLVIILAGYTEDIDRLMSMNPGLTSRFPESVTFNHMDPDTCLVLLTKVLQNFGKKQNGTLDLSLLEPPSQDLRMRICDLFAALASSKSWGNGRDIKSLAKNMFRKLISTPIESGANLVLTESIITGVMETMLEDRNRRTVAAGTTRHGSQISTFPKAHPQQQFAPNGSAPKFDTKIDTKVSEPPSKIEDDKKEQRHKETTDTKKNGTLPEDAPDAQRDAGVTDADWYQLQQDKQAAVAREKEFKRLQEQMMQEKQYIAELKRREKAAADEAERRRLEEERIRAELERRRRDEELAALERQRQKELEMLQKLKEMGVCCMGYEWIKQAGGFRCAGGSHYMSNKAVGF